MRTHCLSRALSLFLVGLGTPWVAFAAGPATPPSRDEVEVEQDVPYGEVGNLTLKLDVYRPKERGREALPVLLMIHGGGWRSWPDGQWTRKTDAGTATAFAKRGYWVASIDYRLSDVAPFPAALLDCKRAVRWVRSHAARLGVDPERVGVWGFSAGGHLALLLGCTGSGSLGDEESVGSGPSSRVQAVASWAGLSDLADPTGPRRLEGERLELARRFIGGTYQEMPEAYRRASPVTQVTRDCPPMLLVHGDRDERVPFSHSEVMLEKLRSAGVEARLLPVKGAGHLFFKEELQDPPVSRMIEATVEFFDRHLKTPKEGPSPHRGEQANRPASRWYKGNTHAHSLWDNGDALPELAAEWYRSRGYDFVALSDHNDQNALTEKERWIPVGTEATDPVPPSVLDELARRFGPGWADIRKSKDGRELRLKTFSELEAEFVKDHRFVLLRGEEIGDSFQNKLIHHNALNIGRVLPPPGGGSVRELLKRAIEAGQAESSTTGRRVLVHLNHPNLGWAVGSEDLTAVGQERYFEVYNGHPSAQNQGDAAHPSTEALWDRVLTARLRSGSGPLLYGLAADDAHHYSGRGNARPGRGWIMVRARELSAGALLEAISAGDFYSSTGVTLSEIEAGECGVSVRVLPEPGAEYTIRFIGSWGEKSEIGTVLQESQGTEAYYAFQGDELYVRLVVTSDRPSADPGRTGECQMAWGQPVAVGWTRAK
jgi:acetyl esterase/lipase